MSLICEIFRSSRKQEMYLFVEHTRGLQDVPTTLLEQFGKPVSVMILEVNADRVLARTDAITVLANIEAQGFYLQMPPTTTGRHTGEPSSV
ncbi:MAG: YcgL domain-containing protein [Halioglobus sp.]